MTSTFIPRNERALIWGERAYAKARAAGSKVISAWESNISATFGPCRVWLDHKIAVEKAMQRGAWDFDVRVRYGNVALLCPSNVDGALREIERNYRAEVRHQNQLERIFAPRANRAKQRILNEARLFLRWFRRHGDRDAFPAIIETLTTSIHWRMEAAE